MNEKDDFQTINEELKKNENLPLPEALTEDSAKELLKDEKPLKKVTVKTAYRRALASAAVFAIVMTVLLASKPWNTAPVQGDPAKPVGKVEVPNAPSDYTQLETMFLAYQNVNKLGGFLTDIRDNFYYPGMKTENTAGDNAAAGETIAGSASVTQKGQEIQNEAAKDEDASGEHGETNEQVKGVNEADIVKNDGTYLYIAVNVNQGVYYYGGDVIYDEGKTGSSDAVTPGAEPKYTNGIAIVKPEADGKMTVVGVINAAVEPGVSYQSIINMYVKGDTLVAVFNTNDQKTYQGTTMVASFDITDRSAPVEQWRFYQNGSHLSSRLIGGNLVLLTSYYVEIYGDKDTVKDNCVPETGLSYDSCERIPAGNICVMDQLASPTYLVVTNIDIAGFNGKPASAAILGGGQNVYCTTEKLYVANSEWDGNFVTALGKAEIAIDIASSSGKTTVYSFDVTNGGVIYKAKATVDGTVLNQFSIDEYNGYLRLATTADGEKGSDSRVYVLDGALKTVGTLKGLGTGERIKSVRFMGTRGYVVTFLQTDPLYCIDLSNPAAPKTLGELKITGFSAYLHPITDTLLVGIGPDGTKDGTNGALKVSLFDVSDPSKPVEADKAVYGGNNAYTDSVAYYDPKAVCYDAKNRIFYFPLMINVYYSDGFAQQIPKNGAVGLTIDAEQKRFGKSVDYVAILENDGNTDNRYYEKYSYSYINRVTYIGNVVFGFSDNAVFSFDRATGNALSTVGFMDFDFPDEATPRPYAPQTTAPQTTAPQTTAAPVTTTEPAVTSVYPVPATDEPIAYSTTVPATDLPETAPDETAPDETVTDAPTATVAGSTAA